MNQRESLSPVSVTQRTHEQTRDLEGAECTRGRMEFNRVCWRRRRLKVKAERRAGLGSQMIDSSTHNRVLSKWGQRDPIDRQISRRSPLAQLAPRVGPIELGAKWAPATDADSPLRPADSRAPTHSSGSGRIWPNEMCASTSESECESQSPTKPRTRGLDSPRSDFSFAQRKLELNW